MFVGIFLSFFTLQSQVAYEKGIVIDSIPVQNTDKETFSLYLPTTFKSDALTKVLFIFEPAARGKHGVGVFKAAAEAYNFVLVCSNDSKNGPYERNFGIANRLFDHVFTNYNIDERGIYLAGFSGGSRLASAIACLTDQVAGVIACGAGFSGASAHTPATQEFAYVGICGDLDMNYSEMIGVKGFLQQIQYNHTLFIFEGSHKWPPPKQIDKAFVWLQVNAHKKGALKLTKQQLEHYFNTSLAQTKMLENDSTILETVSSYERIIALYSSFFETDSIVAQLLQLKKSKAYRQERVNLEKAFEKEKILSKKFSNRFRSDLDKAKKPPLNWWEKELGKLYKQQLASDGQMRKMIVRVRYKVFAMAFSRNNPLLHESTKEQQEFCREIGELVYPERQKD